MRIGFCLKRLLSCSELTVRALSVGLVSGGMLGLLPSGVALASIDPACDLDQNGEVDGYNADTWDEAQQYVNMLNFYSASMNPSALHSPAPFQALKFSAGLEFSSIPALGCLERTVFYGTKTEDTNKSPVLPRLRVSTTLPMGVTIGLSGVPPVTLFGVTSGLLGLEVGYGKVLAEKIEVGARGSVFIGRVVGEMAGPVSGLPEDEVDDVFRARVLTVEASAGYRAVTGSFTLTPYLGLGFMHVHSWMYVGENYVGRTYDENDFANADAPKDGDTSGLYKGLTLDVGAQAHVGAFDGAIDLNVVPTNLLDGNDRLFLSPRLRVGYNF